MSSKQTGQVWELDLPHKEAWVLMALADHADHDGNNVFPGQDLIAWKTGYSERNVRRILDSLEKKNLIIPVSGGRGRGSFQVYKLALENAKRKPPHSRKKRTRCPVNWTAKSGQDVRSNPPRKADKSSSEKRTNRAPKSGQIEHQKADNLSNSHDKERARITIMESSWEPSGEIRARAHDDQDRSLRTTSETDSLKVNLSPIGFALCTAVGWVPDVLSHSDYFQVKEAEIQIRVHVSATPERIILAPNFYHAHNKYSFHPKWISRDWAQINAWLEAQEREDFNGSSQRPDRQNPRETHNARAARETIELLLEQSTYVAPEDHYGADSENPDAARLALDQGEE